jgi:hypothetical protein
MLVFNIFIGYIILLFKIIFAYFIMRMIHLEILRLMGYDINGNKKNNE